MPTYEYGCLDCGANAEVTVSIKEKEAGLKPVCPKCGGKNMVQFVGKNINFSKSTKCGPSGCSCC